MYPETNKWIRPGGACRPGLAVVIVLFAIQLTGGDAAITEGSHAAAACDTVTYQVTVQDTTFFRVRMRFRASPRPERLFMPENSPGGLREVYARFVEALHVETAAGGALPTRRVGDSTWEIDAEPGECTDVTYLVRRHVDDEIRLVSNDLGPESAYFVGTTVLLGLEQRPITPVNLVIRVPNGWSVWTTLPSRGASTYGASSYEEVACAPVLLGEGQTTNIALAKGNIHLVAFGVPSGDVLETIATRFAKVARCEEQVFGAPAEPEILVGLRWRADLDYGGGVARRNGVVMNIGREWMPDPGRFASGTFAHEFFHTWNVGVFQPAWQPFGPTATRQLWLIEGLADYYVLQTFVRIGFLDNQRALEWIGSEISNFENSPARAWASLEDGGPMSDAEAVSGINVHSGGFVVGFVLDAMIRSRTGGRSSLDDVVRSLATEGRRDRNEGYRSSDVERLVRSIGGEGVAVAYAKLVLHPGPVDYNEFLQGTLYRVNVARDSSGDADHWVVEQLPVPDGGQSLSVLGSGD